MCSFVEVRYLQMPHYVCEFWLTVNKVRAVNIPLLSRPTTIVLHSSLRLTQTWPVNRRWSQHVFPNRYVFHPVRFCTLNTTISLINVAQLHHNNTSQRSYKPLTTFQITIWKNEHRLLLESRICQTLFYRIGRRYHLSSIWNKSASTYDLTLTKLWHHFHCGRALARTM